MSEENSYSLSTACQQEAVSAQWQRNMSAQEGCCSGGMDVFTALDNKWYPHSSFGLDSSSLTIVYSLYQIRVSISDLGVYNIFLTSNKEEPF